MEGGRAAMSTEQKTWKGKTWRDIPGNCPVDKKLNLALRRWGLYKSGLDDDSDASLPAEPDPDEANDIQDSDDLADDVADPTAYVETRKWTSREWERHLEEKECQRQQQAEDDDRMTEENRKANREFLDRCDAALDRMKISYAGFNKLCGKSNTCNPSSIMQAGPGFRRTWEAHLAKVEKMGPEVWEQHKRAPRLGRPLKRNPAMAITVHEAVLQIMHETGLNKTEIAHIAGYANPSRLSISELAKLTDPVSVWNRVKAGVERWKEGRAQA
jgi:hypothetical protein